MTDLKDEIQKQNKNIGVHPVSEKSWIDAGQWENIRELLSTLKNHLEILKGYSIELVEINDKLDVNFKPGLFLQTKAFLKGGNGRLCSIQEQVKNIKYYEKINPRK